MSTTPQQQRHLRRILVAFVAIVVLLPLAGLGGAWSWLILPLLLVGAFALREAVRLRADRRRSELPRSEPLEP